MGEYQTVGQLNSFLNWDVVLNGLANDCDGKVIYLVAENAEELNEAEQVARERLNHERLMVAIPREPLPLREASLEVACLTRMQHDSQLIESDPLALAEIQQMTDDAREHLQKLVDKLTKPGRFGPAGFTAAARSPPKVPAICASSYRDDAPRVPPHATNPQ